MKFIGALAFIMACATSYSQSCCCTGAGANYSILPNLNHHVIGLRASYKNLYSEVRSLNPENNGKVNTQHLNTFELLGRFNLTDRLQLTAFVPYHFIKQSQSNSTSYANGLGDMSLLFQYQLLNPLKCTGKKTKHQLRLGAGVKLPFGKFDMDKQKQFATTLQTGTGSVDFIGSAIYTFRFNDFGFNSAATYRINTANTHQYRFGDKLQMLQSFFYTIPIKEVVLMPTVGFNYEYQLLNSFRQQKLTYTGGQFLNAQVGFDIYYKSFAFTSSVSPALMNQLNWSGENKNRYGFEAGVFYNFKTKTN